MASLTPRQVALLIKGLLGLAIVAVGIGVFAEYFGHLELYPSRKRALGSSRLHWVFWLAFFTVLLGVGVIYRSLRDRDGHPGHRLRREQSGRTGGASARPAASILSSKCSATSCEPFSSFARASPVWLSRCLTLSR